MKINITVTNKYNLHSEKADKPKTKRAKQWKKDEKPFLSIASRPMTALQMISRVYTQSATKR